MIVKVDEINSHRFDNVGVLDRIKYRWMEIKDIKRKNIKSIINIHEISMDINAT